jgi:hypothetical protein
MLLEQHSKGFHRNDKMLMMNKMIISNNQHPKVYNLSSLSL